MKAEQAMPKDGDVSERASDGVRAIRFDHPWGPYTDESGVKHTTTYILWMGNGVSFYNTLDKLEGDDWQPLHPAGEGYGLTEEEAMLLRSLAARSTKFFLANLGWEGAQDLAMSAMKKLPKRPPREADISSMTDEELAEYDRKMTDRRCDLCGHTPDDTLPAADHAAEVKRLTAERDEARAACKREHNYYVAARSAFEREIPKAAALTARVAELEEELRDQGWMDSMCCCTGDCDHDSAHECLAWIRSQLDERCNSIREMLATAPLPTAGDEGAKPKVQYCWSDDNDHYYDQCDSREEALAQARANSVKATVWTAVCVPPNQPEALWHAEDWLEHVSCQDDYSTDAGQDWDGSTESQRRELEHKVRGVMTEWLDRHELRPRHWTVDDVQKHEWHAPAKPDSPAEEPWDVRAELREILAELCEPIRYEGHTVGDCRLVLTFNRGFYRDEMRAVLDAHMADREDAPAAGQEGKR